MTLCMRARLLVATSLIPASRGKSVDLDMGLFFGNGFANVENLLLLFNISVTFMFGCVYYSESLKVTCVDLPLLMEILVQLRLNSFIILQHGLHTTL